jgi:hypothetical protein
VKREKVGTGTTDQRQEMKEHVSKRIRKIVRDSTYNFRKESQKEDVEKIWFQSGKQSVRRR